MDDVSKNAPGRPGGLLRRGVALLVGLTAMSAALGGCPDSDVGDPCTPEDEYRTDFSGFAAGEVNVESRSFQCGTRVCLVNHFRGRVSCPLGQEQGLADKARKYMDTRRSSPGVALSGFLSGEEQALVCRVPGSSSELVEVPVLPQCAARQPKDAAYCSCRCDGDDPGASYCACPSGFVCQKFPELDLGTAVARGGASLRGSYCVKASAPAYHEGECPQAPSARGLADACTTSGNCAARDNLTVP